MKFMNCWITGVADGVGLMGLAVSVRARVGSARLLTLGQIEASRTELIGLALAALTAWRERWAQATHPAAANASASEALRCALSTGLSAQHAAMQPLLGLVLDAARECGRRAEHQLADSRRALLSVSNAHGMQHAQSALGRVASGGQQLQRALEALLEQAQQLSENRRVASEVDDDAHPLAAHVREVLREVHRFLAEGLSSLLHHVEARTAPDLAETRAREIRLNATESRARDALFIANSEPGLTVYRLEILELLDAYEFANSQLGRLSEACLEAQSHERSVKAPRHPLASGFGVVVH
jgi:hypothetical protein